MTAALATTRAIGRPAVPTGAGAGRNVVHTADGVRLFVRDWGEGPPIVFLASWSLPSDSWAYQMLALSAAGFRCIAYDRRGHGRSDDPGRGYDYDTLADDLAAVLSTLALVDVTLVGFSMGAGEVVRYLTRHERDATGPRRVARIVLVGTTTPFLRRTADNPDGIDPDALAAFEAESLRRDFPRWIDDNMTPFAPGASPGMQHWVRDMALRTSAHALLACNRSVITEDFRPELPHIRVPTLVVHGDRDVSSPFAVTGRPTSAAIPGAQLVVYEGAPHGLFLTHMDRFNDELETFARADGR